MEKSVSLSYEEATALLEMCLFTYMDKKGPAVESALRKVGGLCREFMVDVEDDIEVIPVSHEFGYGTQPGLEAA